MSLTREILARTVWAEDRGGGIPGMQAVAAVIRNRSKAAMAYRSAQDKKYHPQFGDGSIAGACLLHAQFSCWLQTDPNFEQMTSDSWETMPGAPGALLVADDTLAWHLVDPTAGALYYYAKSISCPEEMENMEETARIGGHIFLKPSVAKSQTATV